MSVKYCFAILTLKSSQHWHRQIKNLEAVGSKARYSFLLSGNLQGHSERCCVALAHFTEKHQAIQCCIWICISGSQGRSCFYKCAQGPYCFVSMKIFIICLVLCFRKMASLQDMHRSIFMILLCSLIWGKD